jgi:hypothetical protein
MAHNVKVLAKVGVRIPSARPVPVTKREIKITRKSLKENGQAQNHSLALHIVEVTLSRPLLPIPC